MQQRDAIYLGRRVMGRSCLSSPFIYIAPVTLQACLTFPPLPLPIPPNSTLHLLLTSFRLPSRLLPVSIWQTFHLQTPLSASQDMTSSPTDDYSRALPGTVAPVTAGDSPTAASPSIQDPSRQVHPLNPHVLRYQKQRLESETELGRKRAHDILSSYAHPAVVDAVLNDFFDYGVRKKTLDHGLTYEDQQRRNASPRQVREPAGSSLISSHRTLGNVSSGSSSSPSPGSKSLPLKINSRRPPPTANMPYEASEKEPTTTLTFGVPQQPTDPRGGNGRTNPVGANACRAS